MVEFRVPTETDIQNLLANLSLEDRREIEAMGLSPEEGLRSSIKNSIECAAVFKDEELACIVGITVEDGLVEGFHPWLLGTDVIKANPRTVLKVSQYVIALWQTRYPFMSNYVDARYERAISWLKHFGANLEFIPKFGIYRQPFYRFTFGSE